MQEYSDARVQCTSSGVRLAGYYLPWSAKKIPYESILGVRRVALSALRGRGRIWGSANPGLWANFDPGRGKKKIGLILDVGKRVKPFVTPDDPDTVEAIIRERAGLGPSNETTTRGPLI